MSIEVLPFSAVIPTINRAVVLRRTLESLAGQSAQPEQVILVDASDDSSTTDLCVDRSIAGLQSSVTCYRAETRGAASQRNQGVSKCRHTVIGFLDDDIVFEPDCVARLWRALNSDQKMGGVSAMITNQNYRQPGAVSRIMFSFMTGRSESSYAGRVLGPAVNLLPEDRGDLSAIVPVEWLNTTCTLYRREALPTPPFPGNFVGYSMMEDLALSLTVGKRWKLANARTARIFHDSQPAPHKSDQGALAKMELVNRHYVMVEVLGRSRAADYAKFALWEFFQIVVCAMQSRLAPQLWQVIRGKLAGVSELRRGKSPPIRSAT